MTSKKFSHKLALIEPQSEEEAIALMISGFIYFLKTHTKKTIFVIVVFLASFSYMAADYLSGEKVKIKSLAPIGSNFSIIPQAVAGGKNAITINGKIYGFYDENFETWKVQGEDAIIVHNKHTGAVIKIDMPSFDKTYK